MERLICVRERDGGTTFSEMGSDWLDKMCDVKNNNLSILFSIIYSCIFDKCANSVSFVQYIFYIHL